MLHNVNLPGARGFQLAGIHFCASGSNCSQFYSQSMYLCGPLQDELDPYGVAPAINISLTEVTFASPQETLRNGNTRVLFVESALLRKEI